MIKNLLSAEYNPWLLLLFSAPNLTFPSAKPKIISFSLDVGQIMHVTEDEVGNLLQIDFLSPHSKPIL